MNAIPPTNLMQIRTQGLELLTRELGPVVMIRFLQQFELGRGDYSTERHQWLDGQTVAELLARLRARPSR
jgi:hypothetical protein